jgi:hypothetical protein
MYLAIMISTHLFSSGCRAFVQPMISVPFLRAASAYASSSTSSSKITSTSSPTSSVGTASTTCPRREGKSTLFATVQEIERQNNDDVVSLREDRNLPTRILADDHDFIKPALDARKYRCIALSNNLQALLVSDPETDVEAAAVHIKAGHFDDPDTRAGLAHL